MDDPLQIRVLLLADGRMMTPEGGFGPGAKEATWEILGRVRHGGEPVSAGDRVLQADSYSWGLTDAQVPSVRTTSSAHRRPVEP